MEIEYLSEFTVVAKLGSFSRAAEELCMSQSSLSKHILTLERELGVSLLQRNSRHVTLSQVGAQILPLAAQVDELKNKIRVAAAKQSSRAKTILSIASIPVMAQYNITGLLAKFQREYPQITLEIMECERQEIMDMLESGKSELAFYRRGLEAEEGLEYLEVCRDNLVAVVPKSHPLAKHDSIALMDLKDEPLLFLDQRTGFHHLYSTLCKGAGFVPNIAYTGHRPENIVALAAQNMGVALLMKRHTDYVANPDVVCIDVVPIVESTVCLVRRKNGSPGQLAQCFWEFVREHRQIDSASESMAEESELHCNS